MNGRTNIVQLFVNAAQRHSYTTAFIEKDTQTTYAQLLQQIQGAAAGFKEKGIGKGDKILVFVPMTTQLYVVVLALLYMGAVPVFLDEWVNLKRLKACLQTVPCKAITASRKLLLLSWFVSSLRKLKKIIPQSISGKGAMQEMAGVLPDDTALVTFTTGSTGTPKAANRTHRFLQAQYNALHPLLDNDCTTTLTLLPIVILLNLCLGKTNLLPTGKLQPGNSSAVVRLLQIMQQHNAESLIASPAITVALAKAQLQHKERTAIRQVITGGGPLFPEGAAVIVNAFPQAAAMVVYGSTEAEPISTLSMNYLATTIPGNVQQNGLPVGSIHSNVQVAIVPFTEAILHNMDADTFARLRLPPGTSGELLVSGPHVLQQYLNNEVAQQQNKFWVNGQLWHRTGDEATLDNDRNLYFLGRCKEVILQKGEKLYPLIFTWLLKQQIKVQEAALLQQNDKLLLVLQTADKSHEKTVENYLEESLPEARIVWVKTIPKDKRHQTKIDYERLRQQLR